MSLIEDQAAHEARLLYEARRCVLCENDATTAVWWTKGCYSIHALTYCDACVAAIRPRGKKEARKIRWHEEPYTKDDCQARYARSLAERPCPPYRSTVGVVA